MAVGPRVAAYFCSVLYIFMTLESHRSTYSWSNDLVKDRDIYFVSQMSCKFEISDFSLGHRNKPQRRQGLNGYQKSAMLCKLFHRASFAMALILLAGDIERNPGYQTLDDVRSTRGLKIGHLNIRSLRNKTDSLYLEGIDNKTIDILTLSESWLDDSVSDIEIELPGFVCVRLDRVRIKEGSDFVCAKLITGSPLRKIGCNHTG